MRAAVAITAFVTPAVESAIRARAVHDGHSMPEEIRLALVAHLAPRVDHAGRWPDDRVHGTDW